MTCARDVMVPSPRTVSADTTVESLARLLLAENLDGVCVVDDEGRLTGVVTAMDLVFQEQPVHLPSFVIFLDAMIPLESRRHAEHDLRKIAGATVGEIMSRDVHTAAPDTPLEDVARLMIDRHLSVIPVVDGALLVGTIDKGAMLHAAFPDA